MINEKYSMLIKYKTRRTIIVLSPNSANLIKILTQFVYSINIRYFSPSSPVFCTAKYRGGVRRTEGLKNCDSNSNKIKSQPLPLPYPAALRGVAQRYRGSALRARGLKQKQKNEKIESAMSRGKRLKETF